MNNAYRYLEIIMEPLIHYLTMVSLHLAWPWFLGGEDRMHFSDKALHSSPGIIRKPMILLPKRH